MLQYEFPALYCPFPSAVNKYAALTHNRTVDWARRFHFLSGNDTNNKFSATNIGWLAARFHPDAPYDVLQLISDWYAWMFFRDDQRDESDLGKSPELLAAIDAKFLIILNGADPVDDDPLSHALADLRDRLYTHQPSAIWLRRFTRAVKQHFASTVWEATNRARATIPDIATYIQMRPVTGGMHVDTEFIEIADGTHLPPEVRSHQVVRRLIASSNNAVCWANDIISLPKELQSGDVHSLVLVLKQAGCTTLEHALERAIEMHDAEVRAFIELQNNLPSFGPTVDANLQRYVSILCARMRGNLDWAFESARYAYDQVTVLPVIEAC